jgi:hypothetical protein
MSDGSTLLLRQPKSIPTTAIGYYFAVFWRGLEMVAESRFRAANKSLATGGSSIFYEL